jgi:hypothetical protein
MKTARERAEEIRAEKLVKIDEQVATGRLIVRKMTEEERLRYPLRPATTTKKPKRY